MHVVRTEQKREISHRNGRGPRPLTDSQENDSRGLHTCFQLYRTTGAGETRSPSMKTEADLLASEEEDPSGTKTPSTEEEEEQ